MKVAGLCAAAVGAVAVLVWALIAHPAEPQAPRPAKAHRVLRVCSDPNNLPFSNDRGEGFENKLAELLARRLGAELQYTWWAQRRGFIRNTLKAGDCDLIMGIPTATDMVLTTAPYYRSTYVFVYRRDRGLDIRSFDDPALHQLRIGVHLVGDDYANTPPAHALGRRHIVQNVSGFRLTDDYAQPNPPERMLEALDRGDLDVAVAWGPLGGWYAKRHPGLTVVPVSPEIDLPYLPFVFDIAMGVRRGEEGFRAELDSFLEQNRPAIAGILSSYGVPDLLGTVNSVPSQR